MGSNSPSIPPLSSPTKRSWFSSSIFQINFDIDTYLNPFIPRPRLHLLPRPIAHILGHRISPPQPIGSLFISLYALVGSIAGVSLACLMFRVIPSPYTTPNPIILGSLGATAILEYNVISSPLSQPRSVLLGQGLSAICGIGITKLFALLPEQKFDDLRWLAGALAVGVASMVMTLTKTIHPPAGATALLAATSGEITGLGWFLLPMVLVGSAVMLVVACLVDNIQRQWPVYWWTEHDLSVPQKEAETLDVEKDDRTVVDEEIRSSHEEYAASACNAVMITERQILVPKSVSLTNEEMAFLEVIRLKLESVEFSMDGTAAERG